MFDAKRPRKPIKVSDLFDHTLIKAPFPRPLLLCTKCGEENSANAGDYWNANPDHVFKYCRRNMVLVTKRVTYV